MQYDGNQRLHESPFVKPLPPGLMAESAVAWDKAQLRSGLRHLLELIEERLSLTHDEAVARIAARCNKSRTTVYSWLSDSDRLSPIGWPLLDCLRYEEAMLRAEAGRFDLSTARGILTAYDHDWQRRNFFAPKRRALKRAPRSAP